MCACTYVKLMQKEGAIKMDLLLLITAEDVPKFNILIIIKSTLYSAFPPLSSKFNILLKKYDTKTQKMEEGWDHCREKEQWMARVDHSTLLRYFTFQ